MRARALGVAATSLLYALVSAGACGGVKDGTINIIDESGGRGGGGGAQGGSSARGGANATGGEEAAGGAMEGGAPSEGGAGGAANATGGKSSSTGGKSSSTGGSPAAGGASNEGGSAGGGGDAGAPGGASGCDSSADCGGKTPICAAPACRACATDAECAARSDGKAKCATDGSCVACRNNADCAVATPICGSDSACHVCSKHSECTTGACASNGRCATAGQVVYALAETGVAAMTCGAVDAPCSSLSTAAGKLTAARPYLVLVATPGSFNVGTALPAVDTVIIGNHVRVAPYDGSAAFTMTGGSATFDDVVIDQGSIMNSVGISCKSAKLTLKNSTVVKTTTGLSMDKCDAVIEGSTLSQNEHAVTSSCSDPGCSNTGPQSLTVERTLFEANVYPIAFWGRVYSIRNSVFSRNGFKAYARTIEVRSSEVTGLFAYNTLYGNENNCSYVNILSCAATTDCGTVSSNLSWGNFPGSPCPDQVYPPGIMLTNSLSETTWPGTGNISNQDPKLVDPATGDYTPGPGSPALDKGSTVSTIMPKVDFFNNPRPRGAGPDIGAIERQ